MSELKQEFIYNTWRPLWYWYAYEKYPLYNEDWIIRRRNNNIVYGEKTSEIPEKLTEIKIVVIPDGPNNIQVLTSFPYHEKYDK